ncbi:TetR family transcriptional regulator [Pendulispora rubella]|uniref:TetR family transcriptional regulator n=1 Tax=Pendulispora rubella TaxID=2741070 RepID=A0ABZ2KPY5_9BACT
MASRSLKPTDERSRDRARTRAKIMEAAKVAFSKYGYGGANIRDIAAEAGITGALVVRYFGSKEKLFEEALADAFDLGQAFASTERRELGEAIVAHLFSEQQVVDLTAMMLLASVDPSANPVARRLAHARMLHPMMKLIGGKNAEQRAALILSLVTGVWFYRFMLPLRPLSGRSDASTKGRVAAQIQRIIDGAD